MTCTVMSHVLWRRTPPWCVSVCRGERMWVYYMFESGFRFLMYVFACYFKKMCMSVGLTHIFFLAPLLTLSVFHIISPWCSVFNTWLDICSMIIMIRAYKILIIIVFNDSSSRQEQSLFIIRFGNPFCVCGNYWTNTTNITTVTIKDRNSTTKLFITSPSINDINTPKSRWHTPQTSRNCLTELCWRV